MSVTVNDSTTTASKTADGTVFNSEPTTNLNGSPLSPTEQTTRVVIAKRTAAGTVVDITDVATETTLALIKAKTDNIDVALSTRLTDAQLRATPVPVSGTVTVANPTTNPETGLAKDGTDITTPTAMPAGGVGIRGWLSAIWTKLNGTIAVQTPNAATPAQSSVPNAVASAVLLAANANRLGATIFNDDTASTGATLRVTLGAAASASSFSVAIAPQGYYEVPFGYTGTIAGIASAATGNARVTELVA